MTILSSHHYNIDSLLPAFQKVLAEKQAKVQALGADLGQKSWMQSWPQGNTKAETAVVDFLEAAQQKARTVVTPHPLSDACVHGHSVMAKPEHSLWMQIQKGLVQTI